MDKRNKDRAQNADHIVGHGFIAVMTPDAARRQLHVSLGVAAALFAGALLAAIVGTLPAGGAGEQTAARMTIELPGQLQQQHAGVKPRKLGG